MKGDDIVDLVFFGGLILCMVILCLATLVVVWQS